MPSYPFGVERQVQYWFTPAGDVARFRSDRHPINIWEAGDGRQFYGFPSFPEPTGPGSPAGARSGAELIQARGQEVALDGVAGQQ